MRSPLTFAILASLIAFCPAVAGVSYDEQFAAYFAQYDFPWQPTGDASRFFDTGYVTAPFDPSEAMSYKVSVKGHRMARIGVIVSTIDDLDSGTVTIIRRDKGKYGVVKFEEMLELLRKAPLSGHKLTIQIGETDRTKELENQTAAEYVATIFSGSQQPANIVAHATFWNVPKLRTKELTDYQKRCLDQYGPTYAPVCSLTEPRGFGALASQIATVEGYTVMEILEARIPVPGPFQSGADMQPGPRFARIFRAETKLSNFRNEAVDDSVFAVPAHYKRAKRVSVSWLDLESTSF